MIQVTDDNGNVIKGIYRNNKSLIVENDTEYLKYKKQRDLLIQQQQRIESLTSDVDHLKRIVEELIGKINGKSNT